MEGPCSHPASALYNIKDQGITICTLCNDVVSHTVYEVDPHFLRGSGGGAGGNRSGIGSFRPVRSQTVGTPMAFSQARPSIEVARRHMLNIARTVQMNDDHVEMALGIYKLAVTMNAVSGTRDVVLCACLYAVCRRERMPHVIYDFAYACNVSPSAILSHMRYICAATHTEVPVADPSCIVQRFAEYLNLGDAAPHVMVCALKLLRAMREDWISCGRRPMGVCAAALIAACCMLGIPRTAEQICGVVRLTAGTIVRRLTEFSSTPAAQLTSIDDYKPTSATLPPAFKESSQLSVEEDMDAGQREMASLYFQLVGEAKVSAPPTPERCQRWRYFISEHCRLQNLEVSEAELDLLGLTAEKQLTILGLPRTKPISPSVVEESIKREEQRMLLKQEEERGNQLLGESKPHPESFSEDSSAWQKNSGSARTNSEGRGSSTLPTYYSDIPNVDDPAQFAQLVSEYEAAKHLVEVEGLREDFDLNDAPLPSTQASSTSTIITQRHYLPGGGLAVSWDEAQESQPSAGGVDDASRRALQEMLWDKERRHALPWELILLPDAETEDTSGLMRYLILDNEERIRRYKLGEALYRETWKRGRARTEEELRDLEKASRRSSRRARKTVDKPTGLQAIHRALKGRGAGTIVTSNIREILPEIGAEDDEVDPDDWVD